MKPFAFSLLAAFLLTGCHKLIDNEQRRAPIIGWGDSLTLGAGGLGTTYLTDLANTTGLKTINEGIGGDNSTKIKVRMLKAINDRQLSTVIWAGRNNYKDSTTVLSDIAAMVHSLGHDRYIVLGVINSAYNWERVGSAHYSEIIGLNKRLAAIYGRHFIDIRTYIVSKYNPEDAIDIKNHLADIPPESLRSDSLHLNAAGYKLVSKKVYEKLSILENQ